MENGAGPCPYFRLLLFIWVSWATLCGRTNPVLAFFGSGQSTMKNVKSLGCA